MVGVARQHERRGDGPYLGAWAEEPHIDGWVWDGAGGHRAAPMQAVEAPQIVQPAYAPELNPVERLFKELRRAIEGRSYPTLQDKRHALAGALQASGGSVAGSGSGRLWRPDPIGHHVSPHHTELV